ncbi:MAG: holo-ACP synthase [Bacillota bacterium]|jgi:holo-[acyl-carrier protein] synthase
MIFGVGTDIVDVKRLEKIIERTPQLIERVFTASEISYCQNKGRQKVQALAARFAAKEAVLKALGTGIVGFSWTEMELSNLPSGQPVVELSGRMAQFIAKHDIIKVEISYSHIDETAVAFAVACCK